MKNFNNDYLAVAATKPILYGGVPLNYMILNLLLCSVPAALLMTMGFDPMAAVILWVIIFYSFHKFGVYFTRRDTEFMSVYLKNMVLIPRKKGATYWHGYNTYRA